MSGDPSENHQGIAAAGPAGAAAVAVQAAFTAEVGEFFERLARLSPRWQMTASQLRRLSPAVAVALAAGRSPGALAEAVSANADGVRSPYAVLAARQSPTELPGPPPRYARPPWCGQRDERTRMLGFDGDTPASCPRCKPHREAAADPALVLEPSDPSLAYGQRGSLSGLGTRRR